MHTNFLKILLYFSLLLEFCRAQVIRYDDKNIQYFGRWKYTNQSATTLLIQLDDTPPSEVKTNGTLPIETNGASIISVTAINKDTIWLDSILLSTAEKLGQINQQKQPPELVEFVGHDLTLGLGTSKSIMTSFPWLVSNLLQIERSQIAFPGAWLMDHDNVFGMETEYFRWSSDQSRYTEPAAVVVLLGAYDKYKAVYAGRLVHFLKRIRSYYPKSAVLVLSEPLGLLYKESQDAVNEINSGGGGDQNVYFIDTTSWVRYGSAYIDPVSFNIIILYVPLFIENITNPRCLCFIYIIVAPERYGTGTICA
jgi:hypothetical protein